MISSSVAECWDQTSKFANADVHAASEYGIIHRCRSKMGGPDRASVVELADTLDLGSSAKACRFESCQTHHDPVGYPQMSYRLFYCIKRVNKYVKMHKKGI